MMPFTYSSLVDERKKNDKMYSYIEIQNNMSTIYPWLTIDEQNWIVNFIKKEYKDLSIEEKKAKWKHIQARSGPQTAKTSSMMIQSALFRGEQERLRVVFRRESPILSVLANWVVYLILSDLNVPGLQKKWDLPMKGTRQELFPSCLGASDFLRQKIQRSKKVLLA